uniref:Small ribosomal subunit protein uS10m n=1 Tax=Hydra vulgaris TaxID=6087 RepID=T2MEE1_HYDVU
MALGLNQLRLNNLLSTASWQRTAALIRCLASCPEDTLEEKDKERLVSLLTVKVRGADEAVLDSYTQFAQRAAKVLQLDTSGKIILPMHIEKRTLLKSPHINKKHRVQYELRTHARMFQLRELTGDTADIYLEYIQRNIPEGVSMSVEQTELEQLPSFLQRNL